MDGFVPPAAHSVDIQEQTVCRPRLSTPEYVESDRFARRFLDRSGAL
jgi:hypothetical protein